MYFSDPDHSVQCLGLVIATACSHKDLVDYFIQKGADCWSWALANSGSNPSMMQFFMEKINLVIERNLFPALRSATAYADQNLLDVCLKANGGRLTINQFKNVVKGACLAGDENHFFHLIEEHKNFFKSQRWDELLEFAAWGGNENIIAHVISSGATPNNSAAMDRGLDKVKILV